MRNSTVSLMALMAALVVGSAAAVRAQEPVLPHQPLASVDIGLRVTDLQGDQARFQRFRDLGDGAFLDRFRFERQGSNWLFESRADHVGRRDQRYVAEYRRNGKVQIEFTWDQVPLFISRDTRTLFSAEAPGVLRVADSIRQGIESRQLGLADAIGAARAYDVESRRDTAAFNFIYRPTRATDVEVKLKTTARDGTMPWGAVFGFSNAIEVPVPIDTRTTDVTTGVEWAEPRGSFRIGYYGSWFDNDVPTLIWDNPIKYTDSTYAAAYVGGDGAAQGRMALWPSSTLQSVNASGSVKLPARSRGTASVTLGAWNQDQPLLPFTINSAIPAIPLARPTADAKARTVAMNYTFTSRPTRKAWVNARYRFYDFDNRTPHFPTEHHVRLDQVVEELRWAAVPGTQWEGTEYAGTLVRDSRRHNVDLDASFTPVPFSAFRMGYGREQVDRTYRFFARTTENVFRASVDTTGPAWLTVRGSAERAVRTGGGANAQLFAVTGQQPTLRQFDIADRDRNRFTGLVQVTPLPALGFSVSTALGNDDYRNSGFGLRDNKNRSYSFTADVTPADTIAASVSYTLDKYTALQNSRNASPGEQFTDPRRNWSIDSGDKTHTVTGNLDLLQVVPKTELRFAYNVTRSRATYVYVVPANSTLAAPSQLAPVMNELQTGTADVRYFLTTRLALGVMYWYDRYDVEDFALGPGTINRLDLPGSLFLGSVYRPYRANSAWVRILYFW